MNKKLQKAIEMFENNGDSKLIVDYIDTQSNPKKLITVFEYDSLNTPSIAEALYMNANTPKGYLEPIINFLYQVYPDDYVDQLKLDREQYLERIQCAMEMNILQKLMELKK